MFTYLERRNDPTRERFEIGMAVVVGWCVAAWESQIGLISLPNTYYGALFRHSGLLGMISMSIMSA